MSALSIYRERRRRGCCVDCGIPTGSKASRCPVHAKVARAASAKLRKAAVEAGLCRRCRKLPADPGGCCKDCRDRLKLVPSAGTNATRERRAAECRCRECDEPLIGDVFTRCAGCRKNEADRAKRTRDELLAKGLCKCGRKAVRGMTRCQPCRRKRSQKESPLTKRRAPTERAA